MIENNLFQHNQIHTIIFDFDGVFTDNKVWIDQDGREAVRCDRGDGLAFDLLRAFQRKTGWTVEFFILTKETNPVVLSRANKLGLICHSGINNKLNFVIKYFSSRFPKIKDPFAGLAYLGNDLNDIPLMKRARFSVAPSNAHKKVLEISKVNLNNKGGEGFVRKFVEILIGIDLYSDEELDDFILGL